MVNIEIISGAYGHRPDGSAHPVTIERGQCCEVPEAEAERLIALGIARMAVHSGSGAVATSADGLNSNAPSVNTHSEENGAEGEETARIDPRQLKELTNDKLRELAEDMGISTGKLKTKAQLIDAITAVEVAPGEDVLPVFGAEAPVV